MILKSLTKLTNRCRLVQRICLLVNQIVSMVTEETRCSSISVSPIQTKAPITNNRSNSRCEKDLVVVMNSLMTFLRWLTTVCHLRTMATTTKVRAKHNVRGNSSSNKTVKTIMQMVAPWATRFSKSKLLWKK